MSFVERRLHSLALKLFQAFEANTQSKTHVLAVVAGMLVTIAMWFVHLSYPYIFQDALETRNKLVVLFSFGVIFAPPFAMGFGIGSLICSQANEPDEKESGPMSGYFYRERADKRWKILVVAAIVGAMNFVAMLVSSGSP